MKLLVIGGPGAGKGTLSNLLRDFLDIPHISSGDLVRTAVKRGFLLNEHDIRATNKGEFVADAKILRLVTDRTTKFDCVHGYVLDGCPRNLDQAEELGRRGIEFDHVVWVATDKLVCIERIMLRGRTDDTPEKFAIRWSDYEAQTLALLKYYKGEGVNVMKVADVDSKENLRQILVALGMPIGQQYKQRLAFSKM